MIEGRLPLFRPRSLLKRRPTRCRTKQLTKSDYGIFLQVR